MDEDGWKINAWYDVKNKSISISLPSCSVDHDLARQQQERNKNCPIPVFGEKVANLQT
jgi:hypothetical protein